MAAPDAAELHSAHGHIEAVVNQERGIDDRRSRLQPPCDVSRLETGSAVINSTLDRKSTRLNSSHRCISYAVFCLKKKNGTIMSAVVADGLNRAAFHHFFAESFFLG